MSEANPTLPMYVFMECKGATLRFHLPETHSNSVVSAAMHHPQTFATKKENCSQLQISGARVCSQSHTVLPG